MTTAPVTAARSSAQVVVAEVSAMATTLCLPDWIRFEVNSRIGFVTMELPTLDGMVAWADALGNSDEPDRYLYPADGLVRYNCRSADPMTGWRYDLNCKISWPISMPMTDDVVDAAELVTQQ